MNELEREKLKIFGYGILIGILIEGIIIMLALM